MSNFYKKAIKLMEKGKLNEAIVVLEKGYKEVDAYCMWELAHLYRKGKYETKGFIYYDGSYFLYM